MAADHSRKHQCAGQTNDLKTCLENLRTLTDFDQVLSFQVFDFYRGKFKFREWIELIALIFWEQSCIRVLDREIHEFDAPQSIVQCLKMLDNWSRANTDNRPIKRSVWCDRNSIEESSSKPDSRSEPPIGKEFIYRGYFRPNSADFILYDQTDLLQVQSVIAIGCPADLISYSAVTRYVLREYGTEAIFERRPQVGSVIHLDPAVTLTPDKHVFLMITRATNRDPLLHETLHSCLSVLSAKLNELDLRELHMPIIDAERSHNNLNNWYQLLVDYFADTNIYVHLHDRVYVSIACIAKFPTTLTVDEVEPDLQNAVIVTNKENTGPRDMARGDAVQKKILSWLATNAKYQQSIESDDGSQRDAKFALPRNSLLHPARTPSFPDNQVY